jgi:hypothetical protein
MVPDAAPLVTVVIVLFCLAYFAMASIPFLFVRLDIPEVWRLFRGLFNIYFQAVGFVGLVAAAAFATSGRMAFAAEMVLLAATVIGLRSAVLQRIDQQQTAGQSGDAAAMRQLRLTHWSAMLVNIAFLASVAASVPFIL